MSTDFGNMGALVIITGPEWDGQAIEISPRGESTRTRVPVRQRRDARGSRWTAVFPALPAGPYVLWRDAAEPAGTVVVAAATVTEIEWWAPPPTHREPAAQTVTA